MVLLVVSTITLEQVVLVQEVLKIDLFKEEELPIRFFLWFNHTVAKCKDKFNKNFVPNFLVLGNFFS